MVNDKGEASTSTTGTGLGLRQRRSATRRDQLDAARWGGVDVLYRCASMGGKLLWDDAQEVLTP